MSQPDLFVVCKNCGNEVSPYVTECPYCGQRVRKRAPKLERGGEDSEPRAKRRRPRLSGLRAEEMEGIAPDGRPVVTGALIVVSLLVTLVLAAGGVSLGEAGGIVMPDDQEAWRYVTGPFVHDSLAYQFVTLVAVGVFGSMIERRFGWFPLLAVFLAAGAAGCAAAVAADVGTPFGDSSVYGVLGANGAALGLLCAWLVDDRRAAARGDDRENDLLGVRVFLAVLLLLPLAIEEASAVAGITGAVVGALMGFVLPAFTRR
ncbi:MAG: rhomboid family intramembrane serine protease [Thermoleophilaceae bacterium]|nr:rhomboid family intramembrane serine protease [Thermoleophilaceae bacterium]